MPPTWQDVGMRGMGVVGVDGFWETSGNSQMGVMLDVFESNLFGFVKVRRVAWQDI